MQKGTLIELLEKAGFIRDEDVHKQKITFLDRLSFQFPSEQHLYHP